MKALAALLSTTVTYVGGHFFASTEPTSGWFWASMTLSWVVFYKMTLELLEINNDERDR